MKRRTPCLLLALCLVCAASTGHAATQGFHAVYSQDGLDVWAVGDSGVVYRSTNGGADYFMSVVGTRAHHGIATRGLNAVMVDDQGVIQHSVDGGGTWSTQTLSGSPDLKALDMPTALVGWTVGAAGTIAKTTDGGSSWTTQSAGTGVTLRSVRFTDTSNGWIVGDGGAVYHTNNGGTSWVPVSIGTTSRLRTVDVSGSRIWIGGDDALLVRSTDGGANWTHVNLKIDSRSDVTALRVMSDSVYVGGGGGFLRRSIDGGATWTFLQHRMHGAISGLWFVGARGNFCSPKNRMVFRTTNSGDTWTMPNFASLTLNFQHKVLGASNIRGSTFALNPVYKTEIYCAMGNTFSVSSLYRSRDEGETWTSTPMDSGVAGITKINAFVISPKDSNLMVAAAAGPSVADRIIRSTDGGVSWTTALTHDFGEYGIPLEVNPDKPDTLFFGGDYDSLYRSTDFGATWSKVENDSMFRSPCDIVCVPDSSNIIYVGDGITGQTNPPGQYYRSTDGGVTFELMTSRVGITGASEIPGLACSRLRNSTVFGTNWSGGGVQRSTDYGATWPNTNSAAQAWGIDIAKDDPNVVVFGVYNLPSVNVSYDGGTAAGWNTFSVSDSIFPFGNNYSFYARDRELILAEQGAGIWKLKPTYSYVPPSIQSITVTSPNGGNLWAAGSVHNVTWVQANVAIVRIEYRKTAGDPWQLVTNTLGSTQSYAWSVPYDLTYDAKIRVSDAWDGAPIDSSDAEFSIALPLIESTPPSLAFGSIPKGSIATQAVTLDNPGSGTLVISSVTTTAPSFTEGRNGFSLGPGVSDTVGVTFRPTVGGAFAETLKVASNAYGAGLLAIPLTGTGLGPRLVASPTPLNLGLWNPGATVQDTLRLSNPGTSTLTITGVASSNPEFHTGRTAFTLAAGASDTTWITYHPLSAGTDTALISFTANDSASAHVVTVIGEARSGVAVEADLPKAFALAQNSPNPVSGSTTIGFALPHASQVALEVFDLNGQRVATLLEGRKDPGRYTVTFTPGALRSGRGAGLPAGMYFYRLRADSFTSTRKLLLLR